MSFTAHDPNRTTARMRSGMGNGAQAPFRQILYVVLHTGGDAQIAPGETTMAQSYSKEALFERAKALVPRLRERAVATNNARSVPAETIKDYWDGSLTPGVAQGQDEGLLLDRPVNVPVPSTSMRSAQLSPVPTALFLL